MNLKLLIRRWLPRIAWVALAALIMIQFVPVSMTNPPIETEMPVPDDVRLVLRRACYDCHSNETVWPWYSRVAPVSWLLKHDVDDGREELNFSAWNRIETNERGELIEECWEEVDEGEMPPWIYILGHPEARLSMADREILRAWSIRTAALYPHDDD